MPFYHHTHTHEESDSDTSVIKTRLMMKIFPLSYSPSVDTYFISKSTRCTVVKNSKMMLYTVYIHITRRMYLSTMCIVSSARITRARKKAFSRGTAGLQPNPTSHITKTRTISTGASYIPHGAREARHHPLSSFTKIGSRHTHAPAGGSQ